MYKFQIGDFVQHRAAGEGSPVMVVVGRGVMEFEDYTEIWYLCSAEGQVIDRPPVYRIHLVEFDLKPVNKS